VLSPEVVELLGKKRQVESDFNEHDADHPKYQWTEMELCKYPEHESHDRTTNDVNLYTTACMTDVMKSFWTSNSFPSPRQCAMSFLQAVGDKKIPRETLGYFHPNHLSKLEALIHGVRCSGFVASQKAPGATSDQQARYVHYWIMCIVRIICVCLSVPHDRRHAVQSNNDQVAATQPRYAGTSSARTNSAGMFMMC
jgi:hypothetical protein